MTAVKPSLYLSEPTMEARMDENPSIARDPEMTSRLLAMRQLLANMPHASVAEALAMLREAFPETGLSDRVKALDGRSRAPD